MSKPDSPPNSSSPNRNLDVSSPPGADNVSSTVSDNALGAAADEPKDPEGISPPAPTAPYTAKLIIPPRPLEASLKWGGFSTGLLLGADSKGKSKVEGEAAEGQFFDYAGRGKLRLDAGPTEWYITRMVNRIFADTPYLFAKILRKDEDMKLYYTRIQSLGAGGVLAAKVYEVSDVNRPSKRLAMKIQPRHSAGSDDEFLSLCKELVVLTRVLPKHKNIVELRDILISPANVYVGTELLAKHMDLNHFFERAGNKSGRRVFQQLAEAVRFMHSYGVMHLDLLPEKILFADPHSLHVKVIDFRYCSFNADMAERTHNGFEAQKWFTPEELQKIALGGKPVADIRHLGSLLLSIMAGQDAPCLMLPGQEKKLITALKSRKQLFSKAAHDLLRQIGPARWGPTEDSKVPSIEQVCDHPWASAGAVEEEEYDHIIPLYRSLIPLSWLTTVSGKVTPKILELDFEIMNHYTRLGSLQKGVVDSRVFECADATDSTLKMAMKVLPRGGSPSTVPEAAEDEAKVLFSFYKELIILTKILPRHENIIELKDVFVTREHIYLITELCQKYTLEDFIPFAKNGTARKVFKQIAETVCWFHQYGVVHMDLHPRHVLFADKVKFDSCRIIDFSKAAYVPELATIRTYIFNDSKWFTPEALLMAAEGGRVEVDIRALGRLLHAMLSGVWEPDVDKCGMHLPQKGLFEENSLDLLSKIGPPPFGPPAEGDSKLITMEEICRHPWLSCVTLSPIAQQVR